MIPKLQDLVKMPIYTFTCSKRINNCIQNHVKPFKVKLKLDWLGGSCTGKSFSEALILASINLQYDKRLFIDLPVQYMKTTSSEHVVYIVLNVKTKTKNNLCAQHVLLYSELVVFMY